MGHIKMPIRADGKGGVSWIEDKNGNVFAVSSLANLNRLNEIVLAVNYHDRLVDLAQEVVAVVGDEYAVDADLKAYARRLLAEMEATG